MQTQAQSPAATIMCAAKSIRKCNGYRSYWTTGQAGCVTKGKRAINGHASGSVPSGMLGWGINACDEADDSTRAAFAAWGSLAPPPEGDLLVDGASADGVAEPCPVSGMESGKVVCWVC